MRRFQSQMSICQAMVRCFMPTLFMALVAGFLGLNTIQAQEAPKAKEIKKDKIVFLGNSITLHGPLANSGWDGDNWGMAASVKEKDYVHLVVKALTEPSRPEPQFMVQNIADFERQFSTFPLEEKLKKFVDFKPDLLILAIAENVPALTTEESQKQFHDSVSNLLKLFKANGNPTIVVRSSFWPDRIKDSILQRVASEEGAIFVDIGPIGRDGANAARSERKFSHEGVAGHPGDRGMQAIADAIVAAIKKAEAAPQK